MRLSSLSLLVSLLLSWASAAGDIDSLAAQGVSNTNSLSGPIILVMAALVILALVAAVVSVLIAIFVRSAGS
jgi:hypothetical protein